MRYIIRTYTLRAREVLGTTLKDMVLRERTLWQEKAKDMEKSKIF